MPKAIVATMTSIFSIRKSSCVFDLVAESKPAWYAAALMLLACSTAASSSTFFLDRQYMMPLLPLFWRMNFTMSLSMSFVF